MTRTNTEKIFDLTAPYDNSCQGKEPRWLFVCTAGLLRSPTAARIAGQFGINARSCGSSVDIALIPISANLIEWAEKIVFMMDNNLDDAARLFEPVDGYYVELLKRKSTIWGIPDFFDYMEPELVDIVVKKLTETY